MPKTFNMVSSFALFEVMQCGHHIILTFLNTLNIFTYPHIDPIYDYTEEEE